MSVASRYTDSAAADAARLLVRLGLAILMIVLPLAGVVSRGAIYVLLPVGGALILAGGLLDDPLSSARNLGVALKTKFGALALFLVFWAGLSLLWTPFPAPAIDRFLKIVGPTLLAVLAAASLPHRTRPVDLYLLPVGIAATSLGTSALAYLGPPRFWSGVNFDETLFERSIITLIVLVWPALGALALRQHWMTAASLAIVVASVALSGFAQVTLAATGAGAFTFAVAMSGPERTARTLAWAVVVAILVAPAIPFVYGLFLGPAEPGATGLPAAMQVWAETIKGQWPRLITGHGFDLASYAPSVGLLPAETPKGLLFILWYDLGVVGAVTFAAMAAMAFLLAAQAPASVAPALLAGLVVILTLAFTGTATVQIWWATLIDCAAIAAAVLIKAAGRTQRPVVEAIADPAVPADQDGS